MKRRFVLACPPLLGLAALTTPARADDYPTRPVHIVAPAPAGGASDLFARIIAQKMTALFGRPFVVENRAGAAGRIGYEYAARAAPDGHTLVLASSAIALARSLYANLPYDPVGDFAPISLMARTQQLMVVPTSLPVRDLREFIAYARANPGRLNYASSGVGNPPHLAAELLRAMAGLEMTHIPYTGDTPAFVDVISGRVSVYLGSVAPAIPHVREGRMRAIAVSGPRRSPALPDVPTIAEAGLPGYNVSGWFGLLAPRATPSAVIARLNEAMVRIVAMPDVQKFLLDAGAEPGSTTVAEFEQIIRDQLAAFSEAIRIAGIRPD